MATNPDSRQVKRRLALPRLGTGANSNVETILDQINTEVDSPLRMSASATPDAVLNFSSSLISAADTGKKTVSPVKKQVFSGLVNPTINFQSLALSSAAHFDVTFPVSTIGQFRIAAFTLIGSGKIKVLFSAEAATEGALSNPGALFVSGGLPIGYVILQATATTPAFKTSGSATNIIENTKIFRFGSGAGGSGSSSSSGSGGGELVDLLFQAAIRDSFTDIPDGTTTVDISAGATDATLHDVANELIRLAYDASKTVTATGTAVTMSSAPSFTVKTGDVINVPGVDGPKKITAVASQTSYTIEAAWTTNPTAAACVISQAVHTVDLNAFDNAGLGLAASSQFTTAIDEVLVAYSDSDVASDIIPDFGTAADMAFAVSTDNTNWTTSRARPDSLSSEAQAVTAPTSSTQLKLRFFANKTSGSGFVNLLSYKVFFHKQTGQSVGSQLLSAFARPTSSVTQNCSHGVSGGKSRFQFTFAYPRGVNSGEASGSGLQVYANGQRVPRFISGVTDATQAYFTEISDSIIEMDTDYSLSGIDFQFRVEATIIDTNSTNTNRIANLEAAAEQRFTAEVVPAFLTAVNATPTSSQFRSDITGRKSIIDLSSDLEVVMGVKRIMTQNIIQSIDEFGSNGQPVFKSVGDKFDQLRFVGGWSAITDSLGNRITSSTNITDYVEVVFYGTGLNILTILNSNSHNFVVSIDGGAETANLASASYSSIIGSRGYAPNQILQVVSGLSQGIHTARIRNNTVSNNINFQGFEVVTSVTSLQVKPGVAIKGKNVNALAVLSTAAYNSGFESGTLGTRGGNVVTYLKNDGTIGKAVNPTNASQGNTTSADHTNEEVVRVYYPREFGAGRVDDFSTLAGQSDTRVFTLDDGTTGLISSSSNIVSNGSYPQALNSNTNGAVLAFTFVGTGLDWTRYDTVAGGADNYVLTIDGVTIATFTTGNTILRTEKLVSGLPFGTHVAKLTRVTASTWSPYIVNFTVYGPKKPSIPSTAIELSQYYISATYVPSVANGLDVVSTGVIRKQVSQREATIVGTWTQSGVAVGNIGGTEIFSTTTGDYIEYTFFGTGFEWRFESGTVTNTWTVSVDGSSNLTAFTTAFYGTGITSFTASTGAVVLSTTNAAGNGAVVYNMPLGKHTVRVTRTSGTGNCFTPCFDIITPVVSAASNLPFDVQNTLARGNNSLADSRKFNKKDIVNDILSNISKAIGVTGSPTSTTSVFIPMPDLSVTHYNSTGRIRVSFNADIYSATNAAGISLAVYINGNRVNVRSFQQAQASYIENLGNTEVFAVTPGFNKIDIYWNAAGTTTTAYSTNRSLTVEEA